MLACFFALVFYRLGEFLEIVGYFFVELRNKRGKLFDYFRGSGVYKFFELFLIVRGFRTAEEDRVAIPAFVFVVARIGQSVRADIAAERTLERIGFV